MLINVEKAYDRVTAMQKSDVESTKHGCGEIRCRLKGEIMEGNQATAYRLRGDSNRS